MVHERNWNGRWPCFKLQESLECNPVNDFSRVAVKWSTLESEDEENNAQNGSMGHLVTMERSRVLQAMLCESGVHDRTYAHR